LTTSEEIVIPHEWKAREHQRPLWKFLRAGGKRAVAVWHRRAGKDSTALNFTAVAAHRRVANYWHMLPTAKQGRKVVWESIDRQGRRAIDQAFPPEIRDSKRDDEMLIRLKCGSTWQVVGSDNFDALIGANPAGVVFSEYSVADPRAWDYIRPILAENGGWALFIYTPRGRNHGAELYEMASKTPGWFAEKLTVDDTKVIGPEIITEERNSGMSEEMIKQEYYCSFQAALVGAYYGLAMETAEAQNRITAVPWAPDLPVITAWDLGIGDSTAIWFCQQSGREIRLIDYYENSGVGLDHYAKVLSELPYAYGECLLPHDVMQSELGTGKTRLETMRKLGLAGRARVLPQTKVDDGINAGRLILPRCWFDAEKCKRGIEALRQYRKAWNDERRVFEDRPLHDWTSHAADAFRYLAVGLREPRDPFAKPPPTRANSNYQPQRWRAMR
jgi:phage terminase large subunit